MIAGMLAFQSLAEKQENFRIVATGVVLELDKSSQVKEINIIGKLDRINNSIELDVRLNNYEPYFLRFDWCIDKP